MDGAQLKTWNNDANNLKEMLRAQEDNEHSTLVELFGAPPFSVLDARQGYWQERKRAWLALGIQSELGRGENLQGMMALHNDPMQRKDKYDGQ